MRKMIGLKAPEESLLKEANAKQLEAFPGVNAWARERNLFLQRFVDILRGGVKGFEKFFGRDI